MKIIPTLHQVRVSKKLDAGQQTAIFTLERSRIDARSMERRIYRRWRVQQRELQRQLWRDRGYRTPT